MRLRSYLLRQLARRAAPAIIWLVICVMGLLFAVEGAVLVYHGIR